MTKAHPDLVLVYNADGGPLASLFGAVHKVVSPGTYQCSLCKTTHGALTVHGEWQDFLNTLPNRTRIHYRDEFAKLEPGFTGDLPAILVQHQGAPAELLVSADEFAAIADAASLRAIVAERLARA
ncbi:hypothetical protein [Qipengyuania marisflavi]|uniref:GTPase n=1 Tax=Qipengyuania marisflavi TaxID=2486356 RepID=A0A5S3P304_9SPHN|nr:hypothetical protein [Qipengyuania marisflavi]TMM47309.1 hypothetical protein FEV51_09580 [Qipengyuania marisflavi]